MTSHPPPSVPTIGASPAGRDTHLRLARRVRVGVVSAGVLGSLGVAGAVAASATTASDPSPTTSTSAGSGAPGEASEGRWHSVPSVRRPSPDEQTRPQPPSPRQQGAQTPRLQQGYGRAHGSTGGS